MFEIKETKNTILARENLLKLTNKPVIITTLEEFSMRLGINFIQGYLGANKEFNDYIVVALNEYKPESHESTFVHELIHSILRHEQFPRVMINEQFINNYIPKDLWSDLTKLVCFFQSSIEHPVIYERMRNNYQLDMEKYFNLLLVNKKNRLSKKNNFKTREERLFSDQQDILDGLEYHCYDEPQKTEILKILKVESRNAYDSCYSMNQAITNTRIHDPLSCHKSAEIIKAAIIKYGEKRHIGNLNKMWKALDIVL